MNTRTHKNNGQPYGCRSLDEFPLVDERAKLRAMDDRGFIFHAACIHSKNRAPFFSKTFNIPHTSRKIAPFWFYIFNGASMKMIDELHNRRGEFRVFTLLAFRFSRKNLASQKYPQVRQSLTR